MSGFRVSLSPLSSTVVARQICQTHCNRFNRRHRAGCFIPTRNGARWTLIRAGHSQPGRPIVPSEHSDDDRPSVVRAPIAATATRSTGPRVARSSAFKIAGLCTCVWPIPRAAATRIWGSGSSSNRITARTMFGSCGAIQTKRLQAFLRCRLERCSIDSSSAGRAARPIDFSSRVSCIRRSSRRDD